MCDNTFDQILFFLFIFQLEINGQIENNNLSFKWLIEKKKIRERNDESPVIIIRD